MDFLQCDLTRGITRCSGPTCTTPGRGGCLASLGSNQYLSTMSLHYSTYIGKHNNGPATALVQATTTITTTTGPRTTGPATKMVLALETGPVTMAQHGGYHG